MLQWIGKHSDLLLVVANVGMLMVWVTYLHLMWQSFRRQLRANILINRGGGSGLEARCLVSNMSSQAVFVDGIILVLRKGDEEWSSTSSNMSQLNEDGDGEEPDYMKLHKGPLGPGEYMDVGPFRQLFEAAFKEVPGLETLEDGGPPDFDQFVIWVVASYGSENRLVSVRRRFDVVRRGDGWRLCAEQLDTEQVRSGDARRQIEQLLQERLVS